MDSPEGSIWVRVYGDSGRLMFRKSRGDSRDVPTSPAGFGSRRSPEDFSARTIRIFSWFRTAQAPFSGSPKQWSSAPPALPAIWYVKSPPNPTEARLQEARFPPEPAAKTDKKAAPSETSIQRLRITGADGRPLRLPLTTYKATATRSGFRRIPDSGRRPRPSFYSSRT